MKNQIQVAIRIKPLITKSHQTSKNTQNDSSSMAEPSTIENWINEKSQSFATNIWTTGYSQSRVYDDFFQHQFLPSFERGLNFTCFLYGQTGSGKTYTLFGPPDHFQVSSSVSLSSSTMNDEKPSYWGIFPRCISHFLSQSTSSYDDDIKVFVSMVELYQDQCYDLLNHHTRVRLSKSSNTSYKSKVARVGKPTYDKNGKWMPPFVNGMENFETCELQGQKELKISSHEELMRICQLLESARHTNEHALNARSSRSHCVVNVKVRQGIQREQILRFVDLAGSEKIKQTKSSGQVLDEAKTINKSLSALGRVLVQLNEGMKFVSYRDSPLTVLLRDALGGMDKTSIIVTVDTQKSMKLETRSSLNFAERCAKVTKTRRTSSHDVAKLNTRSIPSENHMDLNDRHNNEVKSIQNALTRVEKELNQLKLIGAHGRNNPDFPHSTINTFTVNKQKLILHMRQLQKYKQNLVGMNNGIQTANGKEEYRTLKKHIENENVQVTNLRGLVLRQMTTGVWIPPKQSYNKKVLEKGELQKRLRRLNGLDDCHDDDDDELFSTIQDLLLDFKG